jgi:hypothetical protein
MPKIRSIGIIAEDDSDFDAVRVLVQRIVGRNNLTFKKQVTFGCGRMIKKANDYANTLSRRGCDLLVLVHDLDTKSLQTLKSELKKALSGCAIQQHFVCIPVREIEAWFLSDPIGIHKTLNLQRVPRVKGLPESINFPKEVLRDHVLACSGQKRLYLHTKHNLPLAQNVSLDLIRAKCPSFKELSDFITPLQFR